MSTDPRAAVRPGLQRGFWVVVIIALLVRFLYLAQVSDCPLFPRLIMDGAVYDAWARQIAAGDWLGKDVFYQAPLYPYLLGLLKTFGGDGLWPIRVVQALMGSLSCGFLFLAGDLAFSRRVGWIGGIVLALYPHPLRE
jgi:4-amino-4-deoxy-L-arabinose transferase-like glycosyltransferase